jgi:hypothetical protein
MAFFKRIFEKKPVRDTPQGPCHGLGADEAPRPGQRQSESSSDDDDDRPISCPQLEVVNCRRGGLDAGSLGGLPKAGMRRSR